MKTNIYRVMPFLNEKVVQDFIKEKMKQFDYEKGK